MYKHGYRYVEWSEIKSRFFCNYVQKTDIVGQIHWRFGRDCDRQKISSRERFKFMSGSQVQHNGFHVKYQYDVGIQTSADRGGLMGLKKFERMDSRYGY